MATIFTNIFLFALLLSALTLGITIASTKGAIFYKGYEWLIARKVKQEQDIEALLQRDRILVATLRRTVSDAKTTETEAEGVNKEIDAVNKRIEAQQKALLNVYTWEKPVLLCPKCMPSIWGLLLNLALFLPLNPVHLVVAICFSCVINTILLNKQFINIER